MSVITYSKLENIVEDLDIADKVTLLARLKPLFEAVDADARDDNMRTMLSRLQQNRHRTVWKKKFMGVGPVVKVHDIEDFFVKLITNALPAEEVK